MNGWMDTQIFKNEKARQLIKKQRHHFADNGPHSQSYVFPVIMHGCQSLTIKKAECQKILSKCAAGEDS